MAQGCERGILVDLDLYRESWIPITIALNSLNRSIGQPDLFLIVPLVPALENPCFDHALIHWGAPP